jgi:hypothetical protein
MKIVKLTDVFKTSWDELNASEMLSVIAISEDIHQEKDHESIRYGGLVISMLRILTKDKDIGLKINEAQAVDCFNAIKFFQRNDRGDFKTPWLKFPIGGFNFNLSNMAMARFYAPQFNSGLPMYDRSFDQLVYADTAFSRFCINNYKYQRGDHSKELITEMDELVNALIGILYKRPEDFDSSDLEVYTRIVPLHINPKKRSLILHTYANVRSFIIQRYPNLFPRHAEEVSEAPAPVSEAMPMDTGPMWMNLRYDLAETDAFKGLETSKNAPIYDALGYLDKKAYEAEQTRRQHAKK